MFECVITKCFVELTRGKCTRKAKPQKPRYFVSDKCGLKCLEMARCPESLSPTQGRQQKPWHLGRVWSPCKSHLIISAGMVTHFPLHSPCSLASSPHGEVRGGFSLDPQHATAAILPHFAWHGMAWHGMALSW